MNLEHHLARFFHTPGHQWLRQAHPWHIWAAYLDLPLLMLAIWSRLWLDWWSLALIIPVIVWSLARTPFFPLPANTRNWASRAVLGERVYRNRHRVAIPDMHSGAMPHLLCALNLVGCLLAIWATIRYLPVLLGCGIGLSYLSKSWFYDRMGWLYEEMKDNNEEYAAWDY